MKKFSRYKEFLSENACDDERKKKEEDENSYNKAFRCGIDDPLPVRDIAGYETRMDLIRVTLFAHEIDPTDFVLFLSRIYPDVNQMVT